MCVIVTWWGGPGGIEAYPYDYYFLQCFDTVGCVISPVKTRPDMTYNVFWGTLNPTQSIIARLQPVACLTYSVLLLSTHAHAAIWLPKSRS